MNAIRIRQHLTSQVVDLPELAPMIGKDVEIIVIEEPPTTTSLSGPKAGGGKGEAIMSPDFDAPLDEFAEYM